MLCRKYVKIDNFSKKGKPGIVRKLYIIFTQAREKSGKTNYLVS